MLDTLDSVRLWTRPLEHPTRVSISLNDDCLHNEKFKSHVKCALRIFSAHNKNNCRDQTVGILIKLKQSFLLFL